MAKCVRKHVPVHRLRSREGFKLWNEERAPKPDRTPITVTGCRCCLILFFKIKVRPRSCRSYPIWRPCISCAFVFIRMYLWNIFTIAWKVQVHENKKIPSELSSTHFGMWSKTHYQTLLVFHTHSVAITVSYLALLGIESSWSIRHL